VAIDGLDAGRASRAEVTSATAPSSVGTYYYGACVDAVTDELDTTNNCSSSAKVTVRQLEPPDSVSATVRKPGPDLEVISPTVSSSSLISGTRFTLSVTVGNVGGQASPHTALLYYRSPQESYDSTFAVAVGMDRVVPLAAARGTSKSITLTAPSSPGVYYYYACVKALPGQSDRTNDCSSLVEVTVLPGWDLVVGSPTVSNSSPLSTVNFTLSATVSNTGDRYSPPTTLRYYPRSWTVRTRRTTAPRP
jgi:hypothetical protein